MIVQAHIHTWRGHTKGVAAVRWFPATAHLMLSAGMDCRVKIWEVYGSRRCVRTYFGHRQAVRDVNFNNQGAHFLSAEESYNKQNDKVYTHSSEKASNRIPRVQRGHFPSSLMVWLGVSYWGLTEVHFCEKGVKTNAVVSKYSPDEPCGTVSHTMFKNKHWLFQQDSAPAHRAMSTQD
ncbi:hypothetical protein evm_009499 [Chilo suppressalis]|nr:hypothetical protein evm_009499 [Chilo suppressalis]